MGHLTMSVKERERAKVLERVSRGEMTLTEGADMTGVSYRQMMRLRKRFEKDGDQGLSKGKAGKSGVQGRAEKKGAGKIQGEVSGFRTNACGGEVGEGRGFGKCGDAATIADKGGTMEEEAKEISAPKPEVEAGPFWGVGTDGRVASSVV